MSKETVFDLPDRLPEGWFLATDEESSNLHDELLRELSEGHLLQAKPLTVVASRRGATDDILCRHLGETERYTVIHLSWSMKTEINSDHPFVEMDGSFSDFLDYEDRWA